MVTRRILAISGGGFMMEGQRSPINEQVASLIGHNRVVTLPHC